MYTDGNTHFFHDPSTQDSGSGLPALPQKTLDLLKDWRAPFRAHPCYVLDPELLSYAPAPMRLAKTAPNATGIPLYRPPSTWMTGTTQSTAAMFSVLTRACGIWDAALWSPRLAV